MKILAAFFRFDYGDPRRGASNEKSVVLPALLEAGFETVPFFLEDHGFPVDRHGLQESLIAAVEKEKPDFVFFFMISDEVLPETLDAINKVSQTVNWFCDDQWRFEDFSVRVAPHLSHCLTVDKYCVQKYLNCGIQSVRLVHWWPIGEVVDQPVEATEYEFEVSFVGAKNSTRAWAVQELQKAGIEVACFGQGWPNGKISIDRMKEIFLKSKINLNLSNSIPEERSFYRYWLAERLENTKAELRRARNPLRKWNLWMELRRAKAGRITPYSPKKQEQVKGRNFEIAGCGGFQLSKAAIGLEAFFNIGQEIMVYNTISELRLLIDYYLQNDRERKAMAKAALVRAKEYALKNQLVEIFHGLQVR